MNGDRADRASFAISGAAGTERSHRDEPPRASVREIELQEYRFECGDRELAVLHAGTVLSDEDEQRFLAERSARPPYGVMLWPAAIALAHDVGSRAELLRGHHVLELGAGTGLPGIVAASLGARVTQTDRLDAAITLSRRNGERNRVGAIEYRLADWTRWNVTECFDWILGADILYAERLHPPLLAIFERNLAPAGRILLSDPFRATSYRLLERMEAAGWTVGLTRWSVGEAPPRPIGVFELSRPV